MSSSERQPLLANGQLPGRRDIRGAVDAVDNAIPKEKRIKAAQVLGAVEAGKLPSQDQISKLLSVILNSDTLKSGGGASSRTARIGPDGQRVLEDTKNVIKAVKNWGEEKNDNDLLQNFFYNASTADVDVDVDIKTPKLASKDEMSKDAQRAIASLRTLASLLVTSSNFRQLASDAILVSRDILADNTIALADQAKSAAKDVKPTEKERKEGFDFEATQKKGKKVAKGLASGRIQGEIKESIWDEVEDLKDWVEEKLPEGEEAKEKVIAKLQSVVEQAQSNPEYKRSLTAIFNIFKKYGQKAQTALDETKADAKISDEDEKVQQAGRDLRAFVEKLSGKSLDGVISAAQKAIEDVKDDEKLSLYFSDLETYLQRVLYSPGYATSRAAYRKASSLYDDAQSLVKENSQWKEDSTKLQNELQELVDGLTHDKATTQLVESLEDLTKSLAGAGTAGFSSLKAEGQGLYRDVVDVLVPRLIGLVKEIPIPRIEFKSEDFDLVIDDVKLESASFIPDNIRIVQHNDLQFTQGYATYASEYDATLKLRVSGVHFAASNIAFWVSKKTGFAPFEDAGLLDVTFGEKGISFDVTLENADEDNDRETFFKVKDVNVSLSDFDFQVRENDKWISTWFARPIIKAFVKRNLVHAIEIQISEQLRTADFKLYGFQQRVIAATNAKPTAANFVNAIVRDSIFPQRDTSGPVKIKQTGVVKYGRRGEFVLHVGVDEELFPDKPPARVSNTQRQKAKARAGQAGNAAKAVRGSAQQVKKGAEDASNKVKAEGRDLDAKRREQERRDSKKEGWRSEAFDV